MAEKSYDTSADAASGSQPPQARCDAKDDLATRRRVVLFLARASAVVAAWYALQFSGVAWFYLSGYFREGDFTAADVAGIMLDRAVCQAILSAMHVLVSSRLYAYAMAIRAVQLNAESCLEALHVARRRVWRSIAFFLVVIVLWKAAMFVVFGFLFRAWGLA